MDLEAALALVNRIYERLNARRPEVDTAERYYQGDQPLNFATEEWRKANAARYAGFSDNWCGTVVNAEAERAKVNGITAFGTKSLAKQYWDDLQRNEFDAQFSQGLVTALSTSRVFVIVWGDKDGQPLVSFEHPSFVEIEYDYEFGNRRRAALKTWVDEESEYATLYTASEVWKFVRKRFRTPNERESQAEQGKPELGFSGGWVPREVPNEPWPLPHSIGDVPVVEIKNRPTLKGDPISEIAGVMPMQDAINLLWAYLFLSADYASMKARVVTGAEPPQVPILDENGQIVGTRPLDLKDFAEKRIAFLQGDNAKIDEWDAAQLDVFTNVIEIAVGHVAAQTRTPPHYLVANKGLSNLPADALRAAETGLVSKVKEFQTFTDPQLREVLRLMALVKGDARGAAAARLAKIGWVNAEIRSEAALADANTKRRQNGYPFEVILEMDGWSPGDIRRIMKLRDEELRAGLGPQKAPDGSNGPSEVDSDAA